MATKTTSAERRPRILLVGPFPPTTGGVTTFMLNLIGSHLAERYTFLPHTTSRPPKRNVVDNYGYAAMFKGGIGRLFRAAFATLWHLLSFPFVLVARRVDIVQVQSSDFQTFWESCVYLWIARRFRRPTMLRLGGVFDKFYEGSSPRLQRWIRAGIAAPDILIVQSESWRSYLAGLGRTDGVIVLYNSVPAATLWPVEGARNDPPVFVFAAGSEAVRKGAYVLIEALQRPELAGVGARFRLFAVIEPLESQIANSGLPQSLDVTGFVSHDTLIDAMRQADVFLMPSHGEGFPNSLLEAMAAGLATVVTPVGAVPEIVEHDVEGIVIPPGDAAALARAIADLAADPDRRLRLARSAQARLSRQFTAEAVLERLADAYDTLLDGGGT